jgi:hypothetical protein
MTLADYACLRSSSETSWLPGTPLRVGMGLGHWPRGVASSLVSCSLESHCSLGILVRFLGLNGSGNWCPRRTDPRCGPISASIRVSGDLTYTRSSPCAPATAYSSGHSTAKPSPGPLLGPRPLAARLLPLTRERAPGRNRRSSDIVGVIPYRPGRQFRRQSQGVRASRKAPSVWAEDRGASVSKRGLTLTPVTPLSYAEPLRIRTCR